MKRIPGMLATAILAWPLHGAPRMVELPSDSPLISFRIVFLTGSAHDPEGKKGLAHLTARMLAEAGTRQMTYDEILKALFPMATSVSAQVDKEMTTFAAVTHRDNLESFYKIFRQMLLEPGWREEDLRRLRDQTINFLRVTLRENNEEELGKEVLYQEIYRGHPYGWHNAGTVSCLKSITLEDLKRFYREHYTQANLIIGLAGGYTPEFADRLKKDFSRLPAGKPNRLRLPEPKAVEGTRVTFIEKQTRSVAISLGFPIAVRRGHPDYVPLLLAITYFGQHRNSSGVLFQRMRAARGLNYGDYAYIEYFPRGMFQFEPDPNLARQQQIFQIWIRPVEPPNALFALRLALYELDKLVRNGISEEDFQRTRSFLSKYVHLLMKSKSVELGYAIDSLFYGIPSYATYVNQQLASLTRERVHEAIRKHLVANNLQVVIVAQDCASLRDKLLSGEPTPIQYNSPKPQEILEEDRIVQAWKIPLRPEQVQIIPVDRIFE